MPAVGRGLVWPRPVDSTTTEGEVATDGPPRLAKRCPACGETKPLGDFYKSPGGADGLQVKCKACSKAISESRRKQRRETWIAQGDCSNCGGPRDDDKAWCLRCRARQQGYYRTDRRRYMESTYWATLKRNFGIDKAKYVAMLEAQGGVCKLCGGLSRDGSRLAVDHCHATGKVRGLLCKSCNHGLGMFRDNVTTLHRAIGYLERAA